VYSVNKSIPARFDYHFNLKIQLKKDEKITDSLIS